MSHARSQINAAVAVLSLLVIATAAHAQPKPSKGLSSTHVFPAGGRRGSVVRVRIGTELAAPGTRLSLLGSHVTAAELLGARIIDQGDPSPRREPTETPITIPREWESQFTIAKDAPLGVVYWRLNSAQGGTGSRPFIVGNLPERIERESNSTLESAEQIKLPVTINGQIHGERDVDYYRFAAQTNEVIVFDVLAGRIGSRLDPVVSVLDDAGHKLKTEEIHIGSDPVLAFRAAKKGSYLLRVANVTLHGDPGHVYRINATRGTYYKLAFPAGGQAGHTAEIDFAILSGTSDPNVLRKKITFPASSSEPFLVQDDAAASAIALVVHDHPVVIEQEPNDSQAVSGELTAPQTVYGRSATRSDQDWFMFQAEAGQRLTILCEPCAPLMAAMPSIRLSDEVGKTLKALRSVESATRVCRLDWTPPKTGRYFLRVRDLQYGAQGGPEFIYRLTIAPAKTDFALSLSSDVVDLEQGEKTTIQLLVERQGGFAGPIDVTLEGLPEGVEVGGAQIAAGKNSAKVTLTANDDVPARSTSLRVIGRAKIGEEKCERVAQAPHLGCDSEGVALASKRLDNIHFTVKHKPLFRLFCSEHYQYAYRGSIYPYRMEIERLNDYDGQVILELADRQNRDLDGIDFLPAVVPPQQSHVMMPIYLPETMHINVQSQSQIYSQGYVTFTDKHGRDQSMLIIAEKRNMLRTLPPVVKLKAVDDQLSAAPGSPIKCRFRLERTTNFPGPMKLELLSVADESASAKPGLIDAGKNEAEMIVTLPESVPAGESTLLRFRATGDLNGTVIITEAQIEVRIIP